MKFRKVRRMRRSSLWSMELEALENRILASASVPTVTGAAVESIDGTGNNLRNTTWGSAGVDLLRIGPAQYGDGISTPAGSTRPSARLISDTISVQTDDLEGNSRDLSDMVYVWGQFIDHDMDLTGSASPSVLFNVAVPTGDPQFDPNSTGTQVIPLVRSLFDTSTGTSTSNPRQQINQITAFLDGSMVYGSDAVRAAALRTMSGGLLKTSDGNLLPFNTNGLANANDAHIYPSDQLFLAGDVRANENPELTALQTLFVREHNRIAAQIATKNPTLTDEQIYQKARAVVVGEIQAITYNEFLPALLGKNAIKLYTGYKANVNPGIANEFSTAAYRFGHSMLGDDVELVDNNGEDVPGAAFSLSESFFNPSIVETYGIDTLLKGSTDGNANEIDTHVIDSVRNFLFGAPGAGGFDLVSLNIQRGRDHGLADYNTTRAAYGLPKVTSFSQITSDPAMQAQLQQLYGTVDNIDLWVGGLAEDHIIGSSAGPLIQRILVDQFTRLRDGDRFFYANQFKGDELKKINSTMLADVIKRNTTITNLQANVFIYHEDATPPAPPKPPVQPPSHPDKPPTTPTRPPVVGPPKPPPKGSAHNGPPGPPRSVASMSVTTSSLNLNSLLNLKSSDKLTLTPA